MRELVRYVVVAGLLVSCASADSNKQPPRPTKEVVSGGARIRGGGIRMDVQLGRRPTTRTGTAGAVRVTPHAVVQP